MKRILAFLLIISLLLCCGCAGEQTPVQTEQPTVEATVPCTETEATVHTHTFGAWEYGETQMQRCCEDCGELELRDMTDEEQFRHLLQGHWEPYEVTFMGETQEMYHIRNDVWYYYADYSGGDTMTYVSALNSKAIADFTRTLTIQYSHFDPETGTHLASATSAEGHNFQIALETDHSEPLLRLTPELGADMFDEIVFSQYRQVAPFVVGTWAGFNDGEITYITLNSDQTFTSNMEPYLSGSWQLAPADAFDVASIQLFYTDETGRYTFELGHFSSELSYFPDVEAELPDLQLVLYPQYSNDMWNFRKLQTELLEPLMDEGRERIVGTWDSKRTESFLKENLGSRIWTGHTLTIREDGTFTMMADETVEGTWVPNGIVRNNDRKIYHYLFTYPGCGRNGDDVTFCADHSGDLHFSYKQGKTYTHLYFAQYDEAQWADFLAGPDLLPGNYVSQKIVRYDEAGQAIEEPETGYTLTIKDDGTVTGMLHEPVSGTWFYRDLSPTGGHRYSFSMDHTSVTTESERMDDGTFVFTTKIDGERVVIYFFPE